MAILNITPDSFSDGNRYLHPDNALEHALTLQAQGAAILDVGAESTRPGATPISEHEELSRIVPVIQKLVDHIKIPISIDTYKPAVARECLRLGASIINDVTGLENLEMREVIADHQCVAVLMHRHPIAEICELKTYFQHQISLASKDGIQHLILDPGFGFSKSPELNWRVLNSIGEWRIPGHQVLIGTSKKSFSDGQKKYTTKETVKIGISGGADIVRVHKISDVTA